MEVTVCGLDCLSNSRGTTYGSEEVGEREIRQRSKFGRVQVSSVLDCFIS